MKIDFVLNGEPVALDVAFDSLLLDVVRGIGLTGAKECCGVGVCGACTVLVDELPVSSCLFVAACAAGCDVWTVEGLARRAPALLDAFVGAEAMQCGICTPGHVVAAFALSLENTEPSEVELRHHMAGNLCRCTGYQTIIEAVRGYLEHG
jgi:aerobic-type carbon monoxide dehydrogenase small subunit (CoxS/CutS family)